MQLSTKRVITMEWVEGCRANDQESMQQASIRPKDVAVLLLDVFAEMTYVHGFVHADPHPGNILVRPAPHQGRPRAQMNI
jgi:aarF domain-containing kinase